jgi:hypothetical protein
MALDIAMVTSIAPTQMRLRRGGPTPLRRLNAVAPGEFVMVARPKGPTLGFQKVPDPT